MKRSTKISDLTSTEQLSYNLFSNKNLSVEEISRERVLQPSTIMGHLARALEAGYFLDYRRGKLLCTEYLNSFFFL